ncbi:hypothetical protein EC988_000504 [Linderina pennispora]|nr:hypothetical protein EC988_000504 [Linderina pennispora]
MKLFTTILAAVALTLSTVQASLDWAADSTLECAQENWATIKAKCDPLLSTASSMLTPELMEKLHDLLGPDGKLLPNPTIDQLRQAAQIFPPSLFEIFAGKEIKACLATYVTEAPTPTESTTEEATTENTTTEVVTSESTRTEEKTTETTETTQEMTTEGSTNDEKMIETTDTTETTEGTETTETTVTTETTQTTETTETSETTEGTIVSSEPSSWVMSTTDDAVPTSAFKCPPPVHVTVHVKAHQS